MQGRGHGRNCQWRHTEQFPIYPDGLRWVGFWSTAEPIRDQPTAQADIAEMARRYHADDPEEGERIIRERFQRQERISFRIVVGAVHDHLS